MLRQRGSLLWYHSYKNRLASLLVNLDAGNVIAVWLPQLAITLSLMPALAILGRPRETAAIARALAYVARNARLIWERRRAVHRRGATTSDSVLFRDRRLMAKAPPAYYLHLLTGRAGRLWPMEHRREWAERLVDAVAAAASRSGPLRPQAGIPTKADLATPLA